MDHGVHGTLLPCDGASSNTQFLKHWGQVRQHNSGSQPLPNSKPGYSEPKKVENHKYMKKPIHCTTGMWKQEGSSMTFFKC